MNYHHIDNFRLSQRVEADPKIIQTSRMSIKKNLSWRIMKRQKSLSFNGLRQFQVKKLKQMAKICYLKQFII